MTGKKTPESEPHWRDEYLDPVTDDDADDTGPTGPLGPTSTRVIDLSDLEQELNEKQGKS